MLEAQATLKANKEQLGILMARADDLASNQNMLYSLNELAEEAVAEMPLIDTPLPSPSSKSTPPASPLATITNKKKSARSRTSVCFSFFLTVCLCDA